MPIELREAARTWGRGDVGGEDESLWLDNGPARNW